MGHIMKTRCYLVLLLISLPVATARPAEAPDVDWTPLFNGKDLQGWKELPDHTGHWKVENGVLVGRGEGGGYLFSERGDYESFHLRAEAQVNASGDSGIYFRSEGGLSGKSKSGVYPAGIEVQIRVGGPNKTERTGSLAHVRPVDDQLTKPDVWFTMEVIAEGKHIIIKVNDKTSVDFVDENKNRYLKGHIVLQQYTPRTVVKFRKIEIKDLSKGN
jgi:hypothetical protein